MYVIYMTIYNIVMYVIQPMIWIRLLWLGRKNFSYCNCWLERYGLYNKSIPSNGIILHAVSLGEMLLAISLIRALQKIYPNIVITLTSMTLTGMEIARSRCISNNIHCRYFPYDLPGSMTRFIDYVKPKLVIIIETELWPNFINILHKRSIPCVVVNARMSPISFIRYKKISCFIALMIKKITFIAAQSKKDAARFLQLGFKKNKLFVIGNLKFDIEVTQDLLKKIFLLKNVWAKNRQVWIASSTHIGEEVLLLQAHKKLLEIFPTLLMILVPRHPERCMNVGNITEKVGLSYVIKSSGFISTQDVQVVINNSIGELMLLYGISDIAFVGGSLIRHGGHNPLEAAVYAIPILMGPYTFNFNDICVKLCRSGGLITVTDIASVVSTISMLLRNKKSCFDYGARAIKVLKQNQGALQQLLYLLEKII